MQDGPLPIRLDIFNPISRPQNSSAGKYISIVAPRNFLFFYCFFPPDTIEQLFSPFSLPLSNDRKMHFLNEYEPRGPVLALKTNQASPIASMRAPRLRGLDSSSIQNITFGILATVLAITSVVVGILQWRSRRLPERVPNPEPIAVELRNIDPVCMSP